MPATSCAFCTGSGAGLRAMSAGSSIFWRDDEVVVDRDGIPYYTGVKPELTKECRRRVLFAFQSLEGDRDNEEKEGKKKKKKKKKKKTKAKRRKGEKTKGKTKKMKKKKRKRKRTRKRKEEEEEE